MREKVTLNDHKTIIFVMKNGSEISVEMVENILRIRSDNELIILHVDKGAANIYAKNPT